MPKRRKGTESSLPPFLAGEEPLHNRTRFDFSLTENFNPLLYEPNWQGVSIQLLSSVHLYIKVIKKKEEEQNWVICRNVDGPRVCHRE